MKIELENKNQIRGVDPAVGNVYINPNGKPPLHKIVISVVEKNKVWNNVIMIHVNPDGDIVGASSQPFLYVKNHHNLVGKVKDMPTLKIKWV